MSDKILDDLTFTESPTSYNGLPIREVEHLPPDTQRIPIPRPRRTVWQKVRAIGSRVSDAWAVLCGKEELDR